jgi:hypothetical protein
MTIKPRGIDRIVLRNCEQVDKIKALRTEAQRDFVEIIDLMKNITDEEWGSQRLYSECVSELKEIQSKLLSFRE